MKPYKEPLGEMFTRSKLMVLDFSQITEDTPDKENIKKFFERSRQRGLNPRSPEQRQIFNNDMLDATGARYLVSRYAEDRGAMLRGSQIAEEGRTYHLGIDVFAKDLEPLYAPCDGTVIRIAREAEEHGFGNYIFFKPADESIYILFGHLAKPKIKEGLVSSGTVIGYLGDYYNNDNGGWSRHLHIQLFAELPAKEESLIGYSTKSQLVANQIKYPDPLHLFPGWEIKV